MEIKTIDDTDRAVESLLSWAVNNEKLMAALKISRDSAMRWLTLETAVFDSMPIRDVNFWNWETGEIVQNRIRDRFFYEMQKRTGMDFGFCKYFEPAWRNIAEYFLTGYQTNPEANQNLCNYSGQPIRTTCEGTDNDKCVILPEEERKSVKIDRIYSSALREANLPLRRARERAARKN